MRGAVSHSRTLHSSSYRIGLHVEHASMWQSPRGTPHINIALNLIQIGYSCIMLNQSPWKFWIDVEINFLRGVSWRASSWRGGCSERRIPARGEYQVWRETFEYQPENRGFEDRGIKTRRGSREDGISRRRQLEQ